MEPKDQAIHDIDFFSLLNNMKKIYQINLIGKIEEITFNSELILLNIRCIDNKKTCYKGLYSIKGEMSSIPKINDIIKITEIRYKFDDNFNPGFFIKIVKSDDINYIDSKENTITLDFTSKNINKTLKDILNINEPLYSKIFIIIDDSDNEYYILKNIENSVIYHLMKKHEFFEFSFNTNDMIYICNYYEFKKISDNNYYIGLTLISLLTKLTEEDLFVLLENNINIIMQNKYLIGKVFETSYRKKETVIVLLDENKKLFKLITENYNDIKLCQLCLITNYNILSKEDEIPIIKETQTSFTYFTSQNIYFSDKIKLNKFSIIQFHFLDFNTKENNNLYNAIKINEQITNIINNEMNIVVDTKKIKNFEYYPISIQLIENRNKKKSESQTFNFNLLHGFLNKINAFINFKPKIPYFYEYIYYYCDSAISQAKKIIKLNKDYCILICDIFDSSNRLRFNILNIPFQKECKENLLDNSNSLMVCEMVTGKDLTHKIVGIFSIDEINNNIPNLKNNNIFDKYYNDFGIIYDYLLDYKNQNVMNIVNICIEKYKNKILLDKNLEFQKISCYEEEITLSQFKTRIGIIVSYYLYTIKETAKKRCFEEIGNIFSLLYEHKENLTLMQFLRLFKYLLKKSLFDFKKYDLYFTFELDNHSPYLVAYNFNVEEINNIKENSRLFMGYVQIDSYILTNHLLQNNKSYSLSIEPLFIVRKHLLETYEGFFLIERSSDNRYAQSITDEKITIINIKKIFEFSNIINLDDIDKIEKPNILKNHAFSVSMEFRHENNSHHKKNQKNKHITSPIYYFDKENIKKIEFEKNKKNQREDGRLIEALIDENRDNINSLQGDIIYGDLLDINLFIQKDFEELKKKMKEIRKKKNKFQDKIDESKKKKKKNQKKDDLNSENNDIWHEKELEIIYREMKRTGAVMISDEEYSDYLIEEIIKTAKKNNTYDQLPEIIIYIDKRLKEEENEKEE